MEVSRLAHQNCDHSQRQYVGFASYPEPENQVSTTDHLRHPGIGQEYHGIAIRLQWMPGYCEEPGNDTADQLAREAAVPGKTHIFAPLLSREKAFIRRGIYAQWEKEWKESRSGSHLQRVDHSLPANYTRRLYGPLPRNRANLLTQLRTGHC